MAATRRWRPRDSAALLLTTALALVALVGLGPAPASAAAYDRFYANFAGEELMRAINADRTALGLPAFSSDATLERIARDRPLTCPSNSSLVIRGRARDMADRNYLSHTIKGCYTTTGRAFTSFDLLSAFGYTWSAVGEVIEYNSYSSAATTYRTGCSQSGTNCRGTTILPATVASAERFFMSSSAHRPLILSTTFNRFGCAAWASSTGYHYYDCYLAHYGNGTIDFVGPAISNLSGVGASYKVGSTPTFTATATDLLSVLSDGFVNLDGVRIRNWAWDHAGLSATISVTVPALTRGTHTLYWWVRDTATHPRAVSFQFTAS